MKEGRFYAAGDNAIEFQRGSDRATVTISEPRLQTRIRKLSEREPEAVEIIADGSENGSYLYAHIPASWIRINPPRKYDLTEEQREQVRERLRLSRKSDNSNDF